MNRCAACGRTIRWYHLGRQKIQNVVAHNYHCAYMIRSIIKLDDLELARVYGLELPRPSS